MKQGPCVWRCDWRCEAGSDPFSKGHTVHPSHGSTVLMNTTKSPGRFLKEHNSDPGSSLALHTARQSLRDMGVNVGLSVSESGSF